MNTCTTCGALIRTGDCCPVCRSVHPPEQVHVSDQLTLPAHAVPPELDASHDPPPGPSVFVSPDLARAWQASSAFPARDPIALASGPDGQPGDAPAAAATHAGAPDVELAPSTRADDGSSHEPTTIRSEPDAGGDRPELSRAAAGLSVEPPALGAEPASTHGVASDDADASGSVAADADRSTEPEFPWQIELRDPRSAEPVSVAELGLDPRRRVPFGALVAAGLVVALIGAALLTRSGGPGDDVATTASPTTAAPATTAPDTSVEVAGDRVERDPATTSSEPIDASTTATTAETTTTAPTTTTTTAPPTTTTTIATAIEPPPPDVPMLASSFRGGWVAQLSSVRQASGSQRLSDAYAVVARDAERAVVADSDEWAVLSDGYWVIVDPGPFASSDEVQSWCAAAGRSSSDCIPRQLSGRA